MHLLSLICMSVLKFSGYTFVGIGTAKTHEVADWNIACNNFKKIFDDIW